jgi:glycyl-tRNA synthetase alpha subunit
MFNLLDASGGIGVTERTAYILRVRQLAVAIAKKWAGIEEDNERSAPRIEPHAARHETHEASKIT